MTAGSWIYKKKAQIFADYLPVYKCERVKHFYYYSAGQVWNSRWNNNRKKQG